MRLVCVYTGLRSQVEIPNVNPPCVWSGPFSMQLDPNRLEKGEDVEHNQTTLLKYMSQMLSSIFASADKIDG